MGTVLNAIPLRKIDDLGDITPDRPDWLTKHADATGLSVVEVERLWKRFKQITGSNDKTNLYPDNNALPDELSNDIFVKNLLKHFPRLKTDDDATSFGYFISVIQWMDETRMQKKLEALFLYLNNGDPIDAVFLGKLLKHVHPNKSNVEIKALSEEAMKELGSTENGKLNQEQFVEGVLGFVSHEDLEEILDFHIIPTSLVEETNILPALPLPPISMHNTDTYVAGDLVTDDQLKKIAVQAAQKHWPKLALALGFLEYDIEAYKARNNYNAALTIYELLDLWRDQEATMATKTRLREYLRQCGLDGLIKILD